jgi:capsular polysaccharide export protein
MQSGNMRILFLQGPTNSLFSRVAAHLEEAGAMTFRINLSMGDKLFWRRPGAIDFRGTEAEWPQFIGQFLLDNSITDILLLGEQRSYHKIAIEKVREAKEAKETKPPSVNVYVTDFGYLRPDWVILERDGMNPLSHFPRSPDKIIELAEGMPPVDRRVRYRDSFFSQAIRDMLFHLSQFYWPFRFPHYRRHTLIHPLPNYHGIGWRLLRKRITNARATRLIADTQQRLHYVFAMQTEDDFSIRAYSAYPDMDTPIKETIQSFAAHAPSHGTLFIKLHPLDPGLKWWNTRITKYATECGVSHRVIFIDGGDLDALLKTCAGLITVNSTVGIRAIELGCPVITLGEAIYGINGLSFEASLDAFWTSAKKPDPLLADAFLRALAASLHVRGALHSQEGVEAAAKAMAYRLLNNLVNVPLAAVNLAEHLPPQSP